MKREIGNSYTKNEEIYWWKTHLITRKLNLNFTTITDVFFDQKRVNGYEHTVKTPGDKFEKCHQSGCETGIGEGVEGMEEKLNVNHLRTIPGPYLKDRMNWEASSRCRPVMWLVLGGRLWSIRTFQQELKVGEIGGGFWPEGVSCRDCWRRTDGHSF